MTEKHFNLVTDPWIKVIKQTDNTVEAVSLQTLFANVASYRQLAGEMKVQDLAVMRLLLAIVHTVYSRFDAQGQPYEWLTVAEDSMKVINHDEGDEYVDDVLDTWDDLWANGEFTNIVLQYLSVNEAKFDFFGERPFYQVTKSQYDQLVPAKKRVETGSGTVAVKQINRLISESGNTPALFAPKAGDIKNDVSLGELVRWLIMYQSFTGVTDKTKIVTKEPFSTPTGWVYRLNPVYAKSDNLFTTLMENFVPDIQEEYQIESPVWEYESVQDYIDQRKSLRQPQNRAGLYTTWSRAMHIEWSQEGRPTIFTAGIPMFNSENALIEPMTTWKQDTEKKTNRTFIKPAMKWKQSIGKAMWRQFGDYVNSHYLDTGSKQHAAEPGVVSWLRAVREQNQSVNQTVLTLESAALISDGNATSQAPIIEIVDDMTLRADVLFDDEGAQRWPVRIETTIDTTQTVGSDYWKFVSQIADIRGLGDADRKEYASRETAKYYDALNAPFEKWLGSLQPDEDREARIAEWNKTVEGIVFNCADKFMRTPSPRDFKGIDIEGKRRNLFTTYGVFRSMVAKHLHGEG